MRFWLPMALFAVLTWVVCLWLGFALARPEPPQRSYRVFEHSPKRSIGTFPGHSIRAAGPCVEVVRKGRVDTIICDRVLVTETVPSMLQ